MERPKLAAIGAWDTNTAAAVIVVAALGFLVAVRMGFRPVVVG